MKAVVVIPVYTTKLSQIEKDSLKQCARILKEHPIIFAAPIGFNPGPDLPSFNVEEFDPKYFKGIEGYNRLMLESEFYKRFLEYDYMLLYQLDAFVFKDELTYWCLKNYDYIGAPWIASTSPVSKILKPFESKRKKKRAPIFYKVGNGGFSLRKVKSFYNISKELKTTISKQLKRPEEIYSIEDVFWSLKVPEKYEDFKIPHYTEALNFAIDRKPDLALKLNKGKLPFGCHGINKPKVIKFWNPILKNALSNGV